jgi:hypothetical protein
MEETLLAILIPALPVEGRVNWSVRPTTDLPAVSLHRISGRYDHHLQGRSGLVESTVQADCWGRTYAEAKTLARALIQALPVAAVTIGGVTLQGVFINGENDSFEGEDTAPLFRTRIDFSLWSTT